MYAWYAGAEVCYVYLADYHHTSNENAVDSMEARLAQCRWFTRGWTLQELLAPSDVRFVDAAWRCFGWKRHWMNHPIPENFLPAINASIELITGIDSLVLDHRRPISSCSVAERMSWASSRRTSRIEDLAYCLLGFFGVNMPLIYGEGEAAFHRLQQAILKIENDESIYAWDERSFPVFGSMPGLIDRPGSMLAPLPRYFASGGAIVTLSHGPQPVLERHRGRWRLIASPDTVYSRTVRGTHFLVVRLACYQRKSGSGSNSQCLLSLQRTRCGHLCRVKLPMGLCITSRGGILSESDITDACTWQPVAGQLAELIHDGPYDVQACVNSQDESANVSLDIRLGQQPSAALSHGAAQERRVEVSGGVMPDFA